MLKLLKIKNKKINRISYNHRDKNYIELCKHFPSSIREWNNSIYVFNKNSINLIPSSASSALKLIKGYLSFFNKNIEQRIRKKKLLKRLKRLSSNKIYLSNGEFKHTNNNVIINIYIYNRQKYNYISKLRTLYIKYILTQKTKKNLNTNVVKKLNSINAKGSQWLNKIKKDKYLLIKKLSTIKKKYYKIRTFKTVSSYTTKYYKNLLNKCLKKIKLYFLYKQLLYINKSKLNYTYLQPLKNNLENLYNKNVEFNIINLNRFYLNSDILSEVVKLKITRNRRTLLKVLNKVKNKIKIHKKSFFLGFKSRMETKIKKHKQGKSFIIDNLKYRHVTGFRLEMKGRLTKRYTASRSIYKHRYKGNLINIDSSQRGLSTVILKGNLKSNVQFTKLNSKTRIGSFGIKGWISGN